jgi:dienelactone hydrolase
MGGALSLASAVLVDGLEASAPFYGISYLGDPGKAKIPLQLHFGTEDKAKDFSDTNAQDKLEKILKENNRTYEFFRYEGADHGFANEKKEKEYNKEYAELAHQRTLEFFAKYLN